MTGRRLHMIGIGGAGMSGLARLAIQAGAIVSGTDRADSDVLRDLRDLGADARAGHGAAALPAEVDAVVVSTAIGEDNPELALARERGVPVIHRADLLAQLMAMRRGLAIAGAHGKSTTGGMLVRALGDASACIGATIPEGGGTGAVWGTGPWFVAEADESDRSLLRLAPEAAVLLNVDHDHHTTYASIEEVEEVFGRFVAALPPDGMLVAGPDDRARRVAAAARCPVWHVGAGAGADVRIVDGASGPEVVLPGIGPVGLELAVPGRHNVENAACALALAVWCGVAPEVAARRLGTFTGVGRRFELRGTAGGVTVVDDYAHHPVEIAATLRAARERHGGRIVAVYQPHLYSRTRALLDETAAALAAADEVVVTEIYAAREPYDPTIGGRDVAERVPGGAAHFAPTLDDAAGEVLALVRPGDLVLTLGAGDITTLGQALVDRLAKKTGRG